jgi:hypothetical protein
MTDTPRHLPPPSRARLLHRVQTVMKVMLATFELGGFAREAGGPLGYLSTPRGLRALMNPMRPFRGRLDDLHGELS